MYRGSLSVSSDSVVEFISACFSVFLTSELASGSNLENYLMTECRNLALFSCPLDLMVHLSPLLAWFHLSATNDLTIGVRRQLSLGAVVCDGFQ